MDAEVTSTSTLKPLTATPEVALTAEHELTSLASAPTAPGIVEPVSPAVHAINELPIRYVNTLLAAEDNWLSLTLVTVASSPTSTRV